MSSPMKLGDVLIPKILKSQPEAEAKVMAGALERYVFGSNDLFAKRTNVQIHKRFVSFNIKRRLSRVAAK